VISAPRVGFGWRRAHARDVAGVGLFAALTSLVRALSDSVHYGILGARLRHKTSASSGGPISSPSATR
jgi:hypothetical protein